MIRIKKIYGVLRVLELCYESVESILDALKNIPHTSARIFSYNELQLPAKYVFVRSKPTTHIILSMRNADTLLASFKKNYRNEIRKTYSHEDYRVVIKEGFSWDGYYLYEQFEKKAKRSPFSKKEGDGVWFLGYIDTCLVTGVYVQDMYPVLKVISIFSGRADAGEEMKRDVGYLSKRLIYEAGCYGINKKHKYLDLAYINESDPEKSGITRFKLGFNGDLVTEHLYERRTPLISFLKRFKKIITYRL